MVTTFIFAKGVISQSVGSISSEVRVAQADTVCALCSDSLSKDKPEMEYDHL